MIKKILFIALLHVTNVFVGNAQDWNLKLKSTVQLRTWTLTSRADKNEKSIDGAKITLMSGDNVITEVQSDAEGNFELNIPGNGEYYIHVSYPGCNAKKFYVSTKNIPNEVSAKEFKPSVIIGGFMMSKPLKGIDYLGLQQPLLKVEYKNNEEGFDKDKEVSDNGVKIVQNIMDAEMTLINKFCFNTKLGDEALNKKNYKLAKQYYTKALELIPNEEYPKFKLTKAEDGIKEEEAKKEALAQEKAQQIEAQKIANQKAIEQKKLKENASFNKTTSTHTGTHTASKHTASTHTTSNSSKTHATTGGSTAAHSTSTLSSSGSVAKTNTASASAPVKRKKAKRTIKANIGSK